MTKKVLVDASPNRACGAAGTEENWCTGADVPGAFFTDAWADISRWDEEDADDDH
jgi:hypothetical protein